MKNPSFSDSIEGYTNINLSGTTQNNILSHNIYETNQIEDLFKMMEIIKTSNYSNVEHICYHMEKLMELTYFNLKRISNNFNPDRLTFVCSCICKKSRKKSLSICLTSSSSLRIEDSVMKKNVKRSNEASCKFRISFKKFQDGSYRLIKNYNFNHNHSSKRSQKFFREISRNIKIPLKYFSMIVIEIAEYISEHKLIELKILNNIHEKFLNKLKIPSNKEYNLNLRKKLNHMSISIIEHALYLKINGSKELIINIFEYILKKGAHYLRLDSLQVLRNYIESKVLYTLEYEAMKEFIYNKFSESYVEY